MHKLSYVIVVYVIPWPVNVILRDILPRNYLWRHWYSITRSDTSHRRQWGEVIHRLLTADMSLIILRCVWILVFWISWISYVNVLNCAAENKMPNCGYLQPILVLTAVLH